MDDGKHIRCREFFLTVKGIGWSWGRHPDEHKAVKEDRDAPLIGRRCFVKGVATRSASLVIGFNGWWVFKIPYVFVES